MNNRNSFMNYDKYSVLVILTNLARCFLEGSPFLMRFLVRTTLKISSERQTIYVMKNTLYLLN